MQGDLKVLFSPPTHPKKMELGTPQTPAEGTSSPLHSPFCLTRGLVNRPD